MLRDNDSTYRYTPNFLDVLNFAGFCRFLEDSHMKVTETMVTTDLAHAPGKGEADGKPMLADNGACSENLSADGQSSDNPPVEDSPQSTAVDGNGHYEMAVASDEDVFESEMVTHTHTETSDILEDMMIEYAKTVVDKLRVTFVDAKKTDSPEFISDGYAHNLMPGLEERDPQAHAPGKGESGSRTAETHTETSDTLGKSHIKALVVHKPNKPHLLKEEIDRLCLPKTGSTSNCEHTLFDCQPLSPKGESLISGLKPSNDQQREIHHHYHCPYLVC